MRTTLENKAADLLAAGRVLVREAAPGHALVEVTGDHGTYTVTRRRGGWSCPCPAWRECSHLRAAHLVLHRDQSVAAVKASVGRAAGAGGAS